MATPHQYVKQTWTDNNSAFPVSAARMSQIESELFRASLGQDGVVNFDEYTGTDDAKWVGAWTDLRNATRKYCLQLPARTFSPSTSIALFSGAAMIGPNSAGGTQNMEQGDGNGSLVNHKLSWQGGSGTSSTFTITGNVNSVSMSGFAWQAGGSGQFINSAAGSNIYPARWDNITLYGGIGGFGSFSNKFLGTQNMFTGHWTVLGYNDTPFHVGGGDMEFKWYLNSNSKPASQLPAGYGGHPIFWADGLGKTNIQYPYLTNENGTTGLLVTGGGRDKDLVLLGGIYEGRNNGILSAYPVIDIQSGTVTMIGPRFAHVEDSNTTLAPGVVKLSGDGVLNLISPVYERSSSAVLDTFPMLYQASGSTGAYNIDWPVATAGAPIYIRDKNGTTYQAPVPANRINGRAAAPPTVTGAKGSNVALASLLTQLAAAGYIVDSTTA